MNNFILKNRADFSKMNYVRLASPRTNYWVSFASKKLNDYIQKFGESFNLIIVGEESLEGDFFILPFFSVAHMFDKKYLYYDPTERWVASIVFNQLHVRNCPIILDIGKYYGYMEQIYATPRMMLSESDQNDYAIENRKMEINARLKQSEFRRKVISNFSNECCVTGISEQELLIASHIIPWSERIDTRLDPSNGLCLSVLYDKLFDKGYFSLDDGLRVIVTSNLSQLSIELQKYLAAINGKRIHDPINAQINRDYISYHRVNIFRG